MIEKLHGDGQCVCMICNIESGFHRYWTTSCYHLKNTKGQLLRFFASSPSYYSHTVFSDRDDLEPVVLCYKHALIVNDVRKHGTDY